jgi:putative ABC transport system permease protein
MTTDLTLVGLCALLMGGLGVAGAVRGYLDGKRLHIAAMKCVGAPGGLLFKAYLLQVLALGVVGSGAGIVLGAALPHAVVWLWGETLPVPLRPGLYPGPMAAGAMFGLLVALAFSLRALGAARRVRPSELFRGYVAEGKILRPGRVVNGAVVITAGLMAALAAAVSGDARTTLWFTAGAAACFLLFRLLAAAVVFAARRVPRLANPSLRLAVANIHRPGATAPGAIFSLGLGLTALVAVTLVEANLSRLVEQTVPDEAPSFFFIDIQPDQVADFEATVRAVSGVTRVERVPTLRGRITHIAGVPVGEAEIRPEASWAVRGDRFLTYAAKPRGPLTLAAGSWWPENYAGPPRISLTADIGEGFGVSVGDTLTINVLGREVTAEIANLRSVDWSTLALNFVIVFAPGVLETAPQTHIATVYAPQPREESVFDAVTGRFPNVSAIRIKDVLQNVARVLRRIGATFQGVAAVTLITGFLVVAGAVSADQRRRIRDAVIFKVCGATRRDVLTAFAAEFVILGLAAGIIAAVVGSAAAYAMVTWVMDTEFTLQPQAALLTVTVGLALTLVLGLAGTARALARKPAPYLRND